MGCVTASPGRAIASTVRATVPSTPRATLQALADHHHSPRRPTTTTPSHPCRGGCGRPHAPSVSRPPHGTYLLPGPYASPHADPPPFMRAALHACRPPCVPPSMRAACPSHHPATPKPCASSWQNPFLALVCPVPGRSFAMSPRGNPPRQISVPHTCCCCASRTNSRSTACDTCVLLHSSTRCWRCQRIQHCICDVAHVLNVQPLDAQRRVRQAATAPLSARPAAH